MPTRRTFLQQSALISLSPWIPAFLPRSLSASEAKTDERILVVIQLDGGNDGLNTVIPYADEKYGEFRDKLRIPKNDVLKLDDTVGLHPAMQPAAELFEDGRLAIVQGVGYPNPNRSHFRSMAIWHHARLDAAQHVGLGWLGRAADASRQASSTIPDSIYVGNQSIPVALRGRRANAISLENDSDLRLLASVTPAWQNDLATDNLSAYVQRTVDRSYEAARRFSESREGHAADGSRYPNTNLGRKLRLLAKLIKMDGGTRLFYVSQSGYDTHSAQLLPHRRLLGEFSRGLRAFLDDLRDAKLDERVVVMAFSEFGRRVQENGSAGTDHGAAAPVFLAGTPIHGGLIGRHPPLDDLQAGDLRMAIDFREIYATLLDQWLGIDSVAVLDETHEPVSGIFS